MELRITSDRRVVINLRGNDIATIGLVEFHSLKGEVLRLEEEAMRLHLEDIKKVSRAVEAAPDFGSESDSFGL